ncbi:hypothetical protein G6F63_014900 [Rhizopus arrhizus]|nr:hypothetical protein G6F63_014900 [Rhizopus arrhizus]
MCRCAAAIRRIPAAVRRPAAVEDRQSGDPASAARVRVGPALSRPARSAGRVAPAACSRYGDDPPRWAGCRAPASVCRVAAGTGRRRVRVECPAPSTGACGPSAAARW